MIDLRIVGGHVLRDGRLEQRDLDIVDGRIEGDSRGSDVRETLDARGLWVLPGMVDTHVHFREPGRTDKEDFESGSLAAAVGGVTTVLEIQNNVPLMTTRELLESKHAGIAGRSAVNYGLYANVGTENLSALPDLASLVVAYKVFMTQSVGPLTVTGLGDLWRVFEAVAGTGRPLAIHAESDGICSHAREHLPDEVASHVRARPPLAEWIAVGEVLELCAATGTPINLPHLSTVRAVEMVREAKLRGLPVSAATCPHYLVDSADDVASGGPGYKVNPSIKYPMDRAGLLAGLREGVVDHVHSDHAPHTPSEKALPYGRAPSGIAGIQWQLNTLVDLHLRGEFDLSTLERIVSTAPACAFGVRGRGAISPGFWADLVLLDPAETTPAGLRSWSKGARPPAADRAYRGKLRATIVNGRIVVRDGQPVTERHGCRVEVDGSRDRATIVRGATLRTRFG